MRETGKRALVTGAANGLGKAFVEHLIADGFRVIGIDINGSALADLKAKYEGLFQPLELDLTDGEAVQKALSRLGDGQLNIAILSAGISATGRFERICATAHQRVLMLNAQSPITMANALVRERRMAEKSHVIFISSLSHAVGYPGAASYAASKDAVAIYAKSVRKPFKRLGIGVSCAFPGPLRTDHAERHAPMGADPQKRMQPELAAAKILSEALRGKASIYPGLAAKLTGALAWSVPTLTTKMMRRMIFEKLDRDVW